MSSKGQSKWMLAVILFTVSFACQIVFAEYRTWKCNNGLAIEAELVGVNERGSSVSLRTRNGEVKRKVVSSLSLEDQQYVRNCEKDAKANDLVKLNGQRFTPAEKKPVSIEETKARGLIYDPNTTQAQTTVQPNVYDRARGNMQANVDEASTMTSPAAQAMGQQMNRNAEIQGKRARGGGAFKNYDPNAAPVVAMPKVPQPMAQSESLEECARLRLLQMDMGARNAKNSFEELQKHHMVQEGDVYVVGETGLNVIRKPTGEGETIEKDGRGYSVRDRLGNEKNRYDTQGRPIDDNRVKSYDSKGNLIE